MRITTKGQVTIPKDVRDQAEIDQQTELDISYRDGVIVIRKVGSDEEAFRRKRQREFDDWLARVRGTADSGMTAEQFWKRRAGRSMTSTLVNSNVLIDVFEKIRYGSTGRSAGCATRLEGSLVINVVIASEVARSFRTEAGFERALPPSFFQREDVPWRAAYLSSVAHAGYRSRRGAKERVLPDFLIGSHALAAGYRILTRDAARYQSLSNTQYH